MAFGEEILELNKMNISIQRDSILLESIVKSHKLKIDDNYLVKDSLVFNHFYIDYNTTHKGVMSVLSLNNFSKGHHVLEIEFSKKLRESFMGKKCKKIHFWIK